MEPYQKFPKIPENYVHYPLRFYGNITQSFPNSGAPAGPENRFPRQQNVLRGAPRNITDNDKLTNNFLNSVQQFESMKNEFRSRHLHQQANSQRQENLPNFHQNRQNYRSCLNQRLYNPLTGNFESTSSNNIPRNTNIHPNLRFRMPNPAFMSHQMQQRFNLPPCPADLIPPLLPPPVPPMLPPPLPPLPQFQGQGQKFLTNSNYRDKGRIPLLNRPIGQDNVPQMTSSFLDNDTNRQDPYSMPKQSYSKGCSDNSFRNKPSMNKNHLQEDIDSVQSGPSVQCIISVNSSSIGYSDDPNFIQSYKPYECPQRFADPRYLTDCVERSQYARMTNADVTQNSKLKTKSHEKYERQMKISILGNGMNLSGKIDKCEMLTKSQNSNLNLSDFKIEKWSFTSPMKLSVKKVPSLVSRNNISMDTGKENRPQVVLKRLCKSTVKKHSKYLLLTSPNRASTPSDVKLLNQDKRSNSESNIFAQKNKLRKFELAKLESKQLNPLWLSPILSESEQSKLKSPGNESLVESSLKISGRSRPMVKSRKCNRNLFDTIPNQRVQSSQSLTSL
ncbi:hypothetical protein LOTGIDRAFT_159248 [Lottia gigantea]|uniref:Uncharacterized protein n=1 Tax=Lottia gigantea TaxID=225164 RepID=V4AXU6_LOTGI|nr:hypothetical protein LOTGIDRAFT_159248 [Lottia gigantea]ESO98441.1 hypothetical protein LOTGIDRAFT_159248 [Lottia gigantea]